LITAALVGAGWWSVRVGFTDAVMISAICFGGLLAAGLWLGLLSSSMANLKQQEEKRRHFQEKYCRPPKVLSFTESKTFLSGYEKIIEVRGEKSR